MRTCITIEQLEQMRTHELADLLANISMLLRRVPDVVYSQLIPPIPSVEAFIPSELSQQSSSAPMLTQAELKKKKKDELKKIADGLFISYPGNIKNDDLVAKILAKAANGHSEQLAIAELKDVPSEPSQQSSPSPTLTQAELKEKKKPELQRIADGLFISYNQKTTVGELIRKILARAASGHSEQFAILDL
jgi:hypothetical protein